MVERIELNMFTLPALPRRIAGFETAAGLEAFKALQIWSRGIATPESGFQI
jgi:hypothetical protein